MKTSVISFTVLFGLQCLPATAQFTYPGCDDLKAADFKATEVFNRHGTLGAGTGDAAMAEPVQFDMRGVRKGDSVTAVDIYFVERLGKVKYYDGTTKKITTMGTIPNYGQVDNGLMGLALDPGYDSNRWIYFWYSPKQLVGQNRQLRLSRITVKPDNTLDMASEKILINILGSKSDEYHSGGPMTFDSYGDLWVTVGNNSPDLNPDQLNVLSKTDSTPSAEWGPSSTANLRGGIIRIHPDDKATAQRKLTSGTYGPGYTVPAGNFGDYWAQQWESQGKTALATEYRNPAKVYPEVYVKGDRSNYSIAVHPTKRWMAWGVVNYASNFDEFNIATHPVFAGYPYFHANNQATGAHGQNAATPKNNSPFNGGVVDLPPAIAGTLNNLTNVAITGPIYVYDRNLKSDRKFPPHLHQSWMTFSFQSAQTHFHTLDSVNVTVQKTQRVDNGLFAAWKWRSPLQAKYGPDGALYMLNYDGFYTTINPGVVRVDYQGPCKLPPLPTSTRKPDLRNSGLDISLSSATLSIREPGQHEVGIYDFNANLLHRESGTGPGRYFLAQLGREKGWQSGVYLVRVKTAKGMFISPVSFF